MAGGGKAKWVPEARRMAGGTACGFWRKEMMSERAPAWRIMVVAASLLSLRLERSEMVCASSEHSCWTSSSDLAELASFTSRRFYKPRTHAHAHTHDTHT
jgi:hypothetical protein